MVHQSIHTAIFTRGEEISMQGDLSYKINSSKKQRSMKTEISGRISSFIDLLFIG